MALFAKTLQRKLLGLLVLVGFGPAIVALIYNYSIFALGFERVLGTFLQDRAELAAAKLDGVLQGNFAQFALARASAMDGKAWEAPVLGDAVATPVFVSDRQGHILSASSATSETRVEVLPAVLRELTTSAPVLISESVRPGLGSRLVLQASLDEHRLLTCYYDPAELLRATGEITGSSFLRVYSNRGIFPGQPDDATLRQIIVQHGRQLREQLGGWLSTGDPKHGGGSLVGFAESKLLRMKRNEGVTSVEWVVLARMDVQEVASLLSYMMWRNIALGALLAPLLIGLSYLLARRFIAPIRNMHKQALRIGRGDLDARAEVHTGDELEQLAEAFNTMTASLRSSRESLEQYLQSVEKKARQISLESTISRKLVGPFDLEQLGNSTHEELRSLLVYDAFTLCVFAAGDFPPRRFTFISDVFQGCAEEEVQNVCESAFGQQTPGFPAALRLDAAPVKALTDLKFEHCCVVPLMGESGLAGVLALARHTGQDFSAEECAALEQIAGVLAIGIEHIGLYERTRSFALELEQKVEDRAAELQRAQEQLFRVERFAATGRLAANIAHEINNPLGVIKNYLHLFRQKHKQLDSSWVEALDIVQEELDRIARIVRNLLDFYKPGVAKAEALALGSEIQNLMPLLDAGFRKRQIKLIMELDPNLPTIEMPRDHLRQVLFNLLKNAEEAVENHGEITIRTKLVKDATDPQVLLEVSDNGCGIPIDDQAQVFEPFFSRKREGQPQGTGLGLAVTYSIIQSHGGNIDVDSRPGRGTSFKILLPCGHHPAVLSEGTSGTRSGNSDLV